MFFEGAVQTSVRCATLRSDAFSFPDVYVPIVLCSTLRPFDTTRSG